MVTDNEAVPGAAQPAGDEQLPADVAAGEELEERPVSRLVFPIAGHGLLMDRDASLEFIEIQTPFYIPNNHPQFRGLINRRGSLVPVFDIRKLIDDNFRDGDEGEGRILVLGTGDDAVGVILDATPYRVSVSVDQKAAPPVKLVQVFGELVAECFERNGEHFTQVALEEFLYSLAHGTQ